jgi:hypothetical protein
MRTGYLQAEQRTNKNEWMFFFAPISLLLYFYLSLTKIKLLRHGSSTFYACQCIKKDRGMLEAASMPTP